MRLGRCGTSSTRDWKTRTVSTCLINPYVVCLANPPAPCSIHKCPEPQICPKFVPTIVFRGSNPGGPNLSKICRIMKKLSGNCRFSMFRQMFDKFWSPGLQPWKTIVRDKFWTNLGFGPFFNAVRGRGVRKVCPWQLSGPISRDTAILSLRYPISRDTF